MNNIKENTLYYDPIEGTKYNLVNSGVTLASASILGGLIGTQYNYPIEGCIVGAATASATLWFLNRSTSLKPINKREIKLIRNNLVLDLERYLQQKNILSIKIQQGKHELARNKAEVDIEKNKNKKTAKENLIEETKKYEEKFTTEVQILKAYLVGLATVNFAHVTSIEALEDAGKLALAFDTFEKGKDCSFFAIAKLLKAIPKKLKIHAPIISNKLSDIGEKPKLKTIIGPLEKMYIGTENQLNQDKIKCQNITTAIESAKRVYNIKLTDDRVIVPSINEFANKMPD